MIQEKYHLYLIPILVFVVLIVLDTGWIYALIIACATTLGATLGYLGKFGLWGSTAKKQFTSAKVLIVIWAIFLVMLWIPGMNDLSLTRTVLASILFTLIVLFHFIDSYLWYKKEQHELHNKETING